MSKSFWGLVMVFSLVVTAWSGFFLFNELQPKEPVAVPLKPVEPPPIQPAAVDESGLPAAEPAAGESNGNSDVVVDENADLPDQRTEPKEPVKAEPNKATTQVKSAKLTGPQAVTFTYASSSAKKVFLIGEFNKWFREPMKRNGDKWEITKKLKPGDYDYIFVVHDDQQSSPNGRRVLDPKNKETTKDGKLSVLTVKPASAN